MKIAALSDSHGNYYALWAVLRDISSQKVDRIVFLGDFTNDLPWPNECVSSIKRLEGATVVRGNKEDKLFSAQNEPSLSNSEQFAAVFWTYSALSPENRDYLAGLPVQGSIDADGIMIHFAHAPRTLLGVGADRAIYGDVCCLPPETGKKSLSRYRERAKAAISADKTVTEALLALPPGIYMHGHYHTQYHCHVEGRLLICPGSCGLPQDDDTRAAYTIIETGDVTKVSHKRVPYDVPETVKALRASSLYSAAPLWCELTALLVESGERHLADFFAFMAAKAELSDETYPYSNAFWNEQGKKWLDSTLAKSILREGI